MKNKQLLDELAIKHHLSSYNLTLCAQCEHYQQHYCIPQCYDELVAWLEQEVDPRTLFLINTLAEELTKRN